jgi:hypothetical protein
MDAALSSGKGGCMSSVRGTRSISRCGVVNNMFIASRAHYLATCFNSVKGKDDIAVAPLDCFLS